MLFVEMNAMPILKNDRYATKLCANGCVVVSIFQFYFFNDQVD